MLTLNLMTDCSFFKIWRIHYPTSFKKFDWAFANDYMISDISGYSTLTSVVAKVLAEHCISVQADELNQWVMHHVKQLNWSFRLQYIYSSLTIYYQDIPTAGLIFPDYYFQWLHLYPQVKLVQLANHPLLMCLVEETMCRWRHDLIRSYLN